MITEVNCTECNGVGSVEYDISTYTDTSPQSEYRECEECNGSGEVTIETEE